MLRGIRHEDVWGNSLLEGLQGEDRDYVYDRGRTTVSEQWRVQSMLVDEVFQSYWSQSWPGRWDILQLPTNRRSADKSRFGVKDQVNVTPCRCPSPATPRSTTKQYFTSAGNPWARCSMTKALIAPKHREFIKCLDWGICPMLNISVWMIWWSIWIRWFSIVNCKRSRGLLLREQYEDTQYKRMTR